ncbi:MAG: hypothetical protein ACLPY5_10575 [Candidatus Bathyarchaeia archaeon]
MRKRANLRRRATPEGQEEALGAVFEVHNPDLPTHITLHEADENYGISEIDESHSWHL